MTPATDTALRSSRRRSPRQTGKARLPTHIALPVNESCGLNRDSIILLEQVRTLDKRRLREKMGRLDESVMHQVDGGHCRQLRPSPGDAGVKKKGPVGSGAYT